MTGQAAGSSRTPTVDASVSAKAEADRTPIGGPSSDGRNLSMSIDSDTREAHHSDMDCEHSWRHCTSDEPIYAGDGSDEWWQCVRCNYIAVEDPASPPMSDDEYVPPTVVEVLAAIDNRLAGPPRCFRHEWVLAELKEYNDRGQLLPPKNPNGWARCLRCGKVRDEAVKRRNRQNKNRGGAFERSIATKLGARRTGPLGGRDDVLGETVAVQTKKTINFSVRQARAYLDDLSRTYPTRTALVIHAEPGRDREAVVILRLSSWLELHGPDGVEEPAA